MLKCLRMFCRAETCSVYWRNWWHFVVVKSSPYVDFYVPQQDECHKNYYTPRLEQHPFLTTQHIQSPSWRHNLARLYIPLYLRLPQDGNLSLKRVGGFVLTYNIVHFTRICWFTEMIIRALASTLCSWIWLTLWTALSFSSHGTTKTK